MHEMRHRAAVQESSNELGNFTIHKVMLQKKRGNEYPLKMTTASPLWHRNIGRPKILGQQRFYCLFVGGFPDGLPFCFGQSVPLVNLEMTPQTQRRRQVIVGLDAAPLAAAPVGVSSLDRLTTPTVLAVKACHGLQ